MAGIIDPGHSFVRVSAIESEGRTIWIVDAHGDEKRFVVGADEKLTVNERRFQTRGELTVGSSILPM